MVTRRAMLAMLGCCAAVPIGCASAQPETEVRRRAPDTGGILTPWTTITGGWRVASDVPVPLRASRPVVREMLRRPVGVAVRGDTVMIADAGAGTLWRYDRTRDALLAVAPFSGHAAEQGVSMQIDADFSTWIALPAEHAVVQFDANGRVLRRFRDDVNAARPVALALRPERGEVLVADGASAHVVAFNRFGKAFRYHQAGATPLQSVAALSWGPLGLYVLDRLAQQVVVLGARGEIVALVGENQLVQPRAMAVDRAGRVFVADEADQRIKIFRGAQLIGSHGGPQFGRIESLAFDANLLHAADSVNASIHVLLVAPPSLERPLQP